MESLAFIYGPQNFATAEIHPYSLFKSPFGLVSAEVSNLKKVRFINYDARFNCRLVST